MSIPKILHKIWIGSKQDNLNFSRNWLSFFPDHKLIVWDNKSLQPYMNEIENLLEPIPKLNFTSASDIFRLLILRDYGGIYMDHDIEIIKNFSHLLETGSNTYLTFQYPPSLNPGAYKKGTTLKNILENKDAVILEGDTIDGCLININDYVNNCFIASNPRSQFIDLAIQLWMDNYFKTENDKFTMSDWSAGPASITKASNIMGINLNGITQTNNGITVFHKDHLHPVHGGQRLYNKEAYDEKLKYYRNYFDCYAIHHHVFTNGQEYYQSLDTDEYLKQKYSYTFWKYQQI